MQPVELLRMYSVDTDCSGAADFLELVYRIAAAWREPDAPRAVCAGVVRSMCQQRGTWTRPFYANMRRAVKPILDADDAALAALGITLEKRTSSALAYALAEWVEKC
jgi:hypothetical protein